MKKQFTVIGMSAILSIAILVISGCIQQEQEAAVATRGGWLFAVEVDNTPQTMIEWYFVSSTNRYNLTTGLKIFDLIYTETEVKNFSGSSQIVFDYQSIPEAVQEFVSDEISNSSVLVKPVYGITGSLSKTQLWTIIFYDEADNYSGYLGGIAYYPGVHDPYYTSYSNYCFNNPVNCSPSNAESTQKQNRSSGPIMEEGERTHCCYENSLLEQKEEAKDALIRYIKENNIDGTIKFGFLTQFPVKGIDGVYNV